MESIEYHDIIKKSAPWELLGEGYVFLYRFPTDLLSSFDLDRAQHNRILSIGAMFLVDYKDSPVGPYHEILIAPGIFKMGKIRRFSISKILVSSRASVVNGVNNWGIPKELASFKRVITESLDTWHIKNDSFDVKIELTEKGIEFPISTSILPLKLAQELDCDLVLTTARAKGKAKLAKLKSMKIKGDFPQIERLKPIMGLKVNNFKMLFEKPSILSNYFK